MPRVSQYPDDVRSLKAQAILAILAGGFLRLYNGAMPANGNVAPAGTMLVEFQLATPAGVEANGTITFTIPGAELAVADGTASVGALFRANGTRVATFNVGAEDGGGFVLELDFPTFNSGTSEVELSSFTWVEPATGE